MKRTDLYQKTDFPILAIQLLIMVTFGLASFTKWQSGGVPDSFADQFGETWMGVLPDGLILPFYTIVVSETIAFLLAAISFFRAEWLKTREITFLRHGLVLSLFIFMILSYGLRLTGQFDGAANTYFYFGTTLLALWYTDRMQKERRDEA